MSTSPDTKEIVKALKVLTKELKQVRRVVESWKETPTIDDGSDKEE